uniref:Pre-mRNA-splicing factor 38 n=1 Tax=Kalanchoe fedtschenkoi TaxID=63787 RepID=A0A7N1A2Y2_KALFE
MEIQTSGKPIETLIERVLGMNILSSDYFKELYRLKTYHEVIDEIYNQVDHVEPWMTGNCRGPSTAFCLLYKFFTMKLTVKQMHGLLKHPDSPYIRAIGFLYLRYWADPKTLWNWCEPYIKDDEEFSPSSSGRMTTMGVYIRDLLLGQYYFDTLFPRIPVPVMRQIVTNLEKLKLPTKHCGVTGDTTRHGSDDTARRPPSVKAALSVSFGQRAPHRASTRDASPVRRTLPPPVYDRNGNGDSKQSPSRNRSQSRDISDHDYLDGDKQRERDRSRSRDRDRESYRDRDHGRVRDRDRDRERDRDRDRDRGLNRHREKEHRHDYDRRSKYPEREANGKDYERGRRDGSSSRYLEGSSSRRSRSRSPIRSRSPSLHRAAPFDHRSSAENAESKKASVSSNLAKLKSMYGDLSSEKGNAGLERVRNRDSGTEEVIRLGVSTWR